MACSPAMFGNPVCVGFDATQWEEVDLLDSKAWVLFFVLSEFKQHFSRLIGHQQLREILGPTL
jgi:hypothetical protein